MGGNTGMAILEKLKCLSSSREIHIQWIPSHVNIVGNEIADALAKDGAAQPTKNSVPLAYSELHSIYINNKQSNVLPALHWHEAKRPGGGFSFPSIQQAETNYFNSIPEWPHANFDF
ncbi:RNase H domain-containing protein [Trichonephila clavipes]|nr:RNase H domain-containing protein [Trichonephila clavipes]